MTLNPVNRGSDYGQPGTGHGSEDHMIVRRGFLKTYVAPPSLLAAVVGKTAWSDDLARELIKANANISMELAAVPTTDPVWAWIESATGQQGASLKKSFYSLGWPVHPHVAKHLRFLKNFFNTTRTNMPTAKMVDLLLAAAVKYRFLPSVTNGTSTNGFASRYAQQTSNEINGVPGICGRITIADSTWETALDSNHEIHFPTDRHGQPSPLASLNILLAKEEARNDTSAARVFGDLAPILDTPWPLLVKLGFTAVGCRGSNRRFPPVRAHRRTLPPC